MHTAINATISVLRINTKKIIQNACRVIYSYIYMCVCTYLHIYIHVYNNHYTNVHYCISPNSVWITMTHAYNGVIYCPLVTL